MSGGIDPLLPEDDDAAIARASSAVDLTALFDRHRVRLVRIASAITLDRLLAEELVSEAFVALQKHVGSVADPLADLQRGVVNLATTRKSDGRGLTPRSRRKIAARKPAPVVPTLHRPDLVAAWGAFARLSPRQRAVLVLAERQHLDDASISDLLGWSRRAVAAARTGAIAAVGRATGAVAPSSLVAELLGIVMPQLVAGDDAPTDVDVPDPTPAGPTSLRLLVPAEPRGHRWVWAVTALVLVAAMVGTVALISSRQGDLLPVTEDTAPDSVGVILPEWYDVMRPLLPEDFDRLALVTLDAERIGYLAIDTASGRSLSIGIIRRPAQSPPTSGPTVWTEVPGGHRVQRSDGSTVEVACELCDAAGPAPSTTLELPDVRAITARIASGFALDEVGSSFGAPSAERTGADQIAAAITDVVPDAEVVAPAGGVTSGSASPGAAAGSPLQRVESEDASVSVTVVHGVLPPTTNLLRPPVTIYADTAIGWMVGPGGTAVRVRAPASAGVGGPATAEALLDALADVAAPPEGSAEPDGSS